ncbi:MAG: hypothetical protein RL398_892 [Planctomycetota bacterium]|jgi:hypothetical protein
MRWIALALLAAASLPAQTVFATDFESGLPAEIQAGTALIEGVQGYANLGTRSTFAGSFLRSATGNTITLQLSNLPAHQVLHLDFLFAAIDSLDGTGNYPQGDYFKITVDGVTVFREAFANALPQQIQTYVPPAGVQLARHVDLGFGGPGSYYTDSAYDLGADPFFASIPHSASTLTVAFVIEGPGIQPLYDESWALDNLRIHLGNGSVGWTAPYGTGCGPVLNATSIPSLSQPLNLAMTALPANTVFSFLSVGLSIAQFGSFVLPLPLDNYGMPGCWLLQDASENSALPMVTAPLVANASIPIPAAAAFVGVQFYMQGWVIAPGTNAMGIRFSNGLRARIGQ